MILTKGTMVAHYRIVEKIGAGGMGEVYLVEDTKLKRKVALKFLPTQFSGDADFKARFVREAEATAKLNHPNIVTIYEVSEYQGRPFFAMELVEGQSLRDLAKGKELGIDRIIELAIQVCDGLSAAHEKQVVHRDIKPSNIVIDAYGRPKVLDFGLAAIQGGEHLTKTGSTLGTVRYMSPEQVQGQEVDHRSDLFSLGVVLYELIAGRTPFEKDNEAATLKAITQDSPEPLARYKADIPDELQRTVSKLLEKDPSLRYQHADGVISDLKRMITPTQSSMAVTAAKKKSTLPLAALALVIIAALVVVWIRYWPSDDSVQVISSSPERKMLAVLPFENLGSPDDEYFAAGITDEITAKLASIKALRVTSRTSAVQYKQTDKSLKQIGKELGVDYILEGTIRWDKSGDTDRVRIIPQLIRVSDDSHIWAETYERAIKQIFAVQANIATQIARALNVALLEPEELMLKEEPTQNIEAYHYYLGGLELWNDGAGVEQSIPMLKKAVELDSSFYQAHSLLAHYYGYRHINGMCEAEPCCELAEEAAKKAIRFADGLPDGSVGLGFYHYYCSRDYESAIELFGRVLESQPSNVDLMWAIGYVYRRSGRWEEGLAMMRQAYQLSPAVFGDVHTLAMTLLYMHRLEEAQQIVDDFLELEPQNYRALGWKSSLIWLTTGDSVQTLEAMKTVDLHSPRPYAEYWFEVFDLFMGRFRSAIGRREIPGSYEFADSVEFYLSRGYSYRQLDEPKLSFIYYDSALMVAEQRDESQPDDAFNMMDLAEAYAGLGRKEEAIKVAETASQLLPVSMDALQGARINWSLAYVYTEVGEYDKAIDLLEWLMANPSMLQFIDLRMMPEWDPLRDHPRFQALLEKYENKYE